MKQTKRTALAAAVEQTVMDFMREERRANPPAAQRAVKALPAPIKIPDGLAASLRAAGRSGTNLPAVREPFMPAQFPPAVLKGLPAGTPKMAMDEISQSTISWANNSLVSAFEEGLIFLGYPYLAELSQRAEYRKVSERLATEMTRKWIRLKGGTKRVEIMTKEMDRLHVREGFQKLAVQDGFFGRSHLYIDTGDTNNPDELKTSIGGGDDETSRRKIGKGSIKRLKVVEAMWCYPLNYVANDPLSPSWYKPSEWQVMGKAVHMSRLLTFVGREVADMLKPAYAFGGLSLTQIAKPYVDNWLHTRQSVADLIRRFSTNGIKVDLAALMTGQGQEFLKRMDLFTACADNKGLMVLNKDSEEFFQFNVPLGTLDKLQAQAQEQIASVVSIPLIVLLGISPSGLNATGDSELRAFYDWVHAYQRHLYGRHLKTVIDLIQLSTFGDIDPSLTYDFEPLWSLDEKGKAEVRKTEAEADAILVNDVGSISAEEARGRVANDPDAPYGDIDPLDVPPPPDDGGGGDPEDGVDIDDDVTVDPANENVDPPDKDIEEAA